MRSYAACICVFVSIAAEVPGALADQAASSERGSASRAPDAAGAPVSAIQPPGHGGTAVEPRPEHAPRRRDASWREVFSGPFVSSRLFSMPTAEVVGAYQLSLSGDASLLSESRVLSTSGVVAFGFGDIAQLEYRSSTAIETRDAAISSDEIRIPTLGVQLEMPYRLHRHVPELAVALRFGLPRTESSADGRIRHEERATDLYFMGRLALGPVTLHGGARISAAEITSTGESAPDDAAETLVLPAGGIEIQVSEQTRVVGELARVPLFAPGDDARPSDIRSGMFGRGGVRWRLAPWLIMDASVGYRIEVERLEMSVDSMTHALVDWDIRLGGEIIVPWGAVLCRSSGRFCE